MLSKPCFVSNTKKGSTRTPNFIRVEGQFLSNMGDLLISMPQKNNFFVRDSVADTLIRQIKKLKKAFARPLPECIFSLVIAIEPLRIEGEMKYCCLRLGASIYCAVCSPLLPPARVRVFNKLISLIKSPCRRTSIIPQLRYNSSPKYAV